MGVEHNKENIPVGEPTYEVIKDKQIRAAITRGLKTAGFKEGTSYIPSQSNKKELLIQITRLEGEPVSNTGVIYLQNGADFTLKNGEINITDIGIRKMQEHYNSLLSIIQDKQALKISTHNQLEKLTT